MQFNFWVKIEQHEKVLRRCINECPGKSTTRSVTSNRVTTTK